MEVFFQQFKDEKMSVTLSTDFGDLKLEIFCDLVPKTAEVILAPYLSGI
jgi:hypothetical protein